VIRVGILTRKQRKEVGAVIAQERQKIILQIIAEQGVVTVAEMCQRFGV